MNNNLKSEIQFEDIVASKQNSVELLLNILETENNPQRLNKVAFILVDHFKDDRIETILMERIKDKKLKNKNGTLLYLLGEYTNNKKYLIFLLDLILRNKDDGEIFMSAYSMIINLHSPLDQKDILKALQQLELEKERKNMDLERKSLIDSLLNYFEGQKEIAEFYQQFNET